MQSNEYFEPFLGLIVSTVERSHIGKALETENLRSQEVPRVDQGCSELVWREDWESSPTLLKMQLLARFPIKLAGVLGKAKVSGCSGPTSGYLNAFQNEYEMWN